MRGTKIFDWTSTDRTLGSSWLSSFFALRCSDGLVHLRLLLVQNARRLVKPRAKKRSPRTRAPRSTVVPKPGPGDDDDLPFEFSGFRPEVPSPRPPRIGLPEDAPERSAIAAAVIVLLGRRLRLAGAKLFSALRVRVPASGFTTFVDAAVIAEAPLRDAILPSHVVNPLVIVDVRMHLDDQEHDEQLRELTKLESIRDYVRIAAGGLQVEVLARPSAAEPWTRARVGAGDIVVLPSIGAVFAVDELREAAGLG